MFTLTVNPSSEPGNGPLPAPSTHSPLIITLSCTKNLKSDACAVPPTTCLIIVSVTLRELVKVHSFVSPALIVVSKGIPQSLEKFGL